MRDRFIRYDDVDATTILKCATSYETNALLAPAVRSELGQELRLLLGSEEYNNNKNNNNNNNNKQLELKGIVKQLVMADTKQEKLITLNNIDGLKDREKRLWQIEKGLQMVDMVKEKSSPEALKNVDEVANTSKIAKSGKMIFFLLSI